MLRRKGDNRWKDLLVANALKLEYVKRRLSEICLELEELVTKLEVPDYPLIKEKGVSQTLRRFSYT